MRDVGTMLRKDIMCWGMFRLMTIDICLVASGVKYQYCRFCRVEKLLGPSTVLIKLGGKSVEYSKFNLLSVFRPVVGRSPAAVTQTGGVARRGKQ